MIFNRSSVGVWKSIASCVALGSALFGALGISKPAFAAPPGSGWAQTFNDDFNGNALDRTKWITTWSGGNRNVGWSQELMDDNNVTVSNGQLHIRQYINSSGSNRAGVVSTYDKANANGPKWEQKYGFFEGRIKMNRHNGNLNAFWMANKDTWPPEIDIVEQLGASPNEAHLTQHWYDSAATDNNASDMSHITGPDFSADWHTFGMYWSPTTMIWYIDGIEKKRMPNRMATSSKGDLPQFLMANIHSGNSWAGYPDLNDKNPYYMDLDYVRAWNKTDWSVTPGDEYSLSRNGWTASASNSNGGAANNALDGNSGTIYSTGASPVYGDWFRVDMGTSRIFNKIYIDNGTRPNDFPSYFTLQKSDDGNTWSDIWSGYGSTNQYIYLNSTTARYLKIAFQGSTNNWWTIAELKIYNDTGVAVVTSTPTPTPTTTPSVGANLMTNPGFEANGAATQTPSGWSEAEYNGTWGLITPPDASYTESGSSNSGSFHGTHWRPWSYKVYTWQTKTGLANGLYTARCWAKSSGGQISCQLEAKDYGGSTSSATLPVGGTYTQVTIPNINVTNGQCTVGVWSDASGNNWASFDDVELFKQ